MSTVLPFRIPSGVPAGGQFVESSRGESDRLADLDGSCSDPLLVIEPGQTVSLDTADSELAAAVVDLRGLTLARSKDGRQVRTQAVIGCDIAQAIARTGRIRRMNPTDSDLRAYFSTRREVIARSLSGLRGAVSLDLDRGEVTFAHTHAYSDDVPAGEGEILARFCADTDIITADFGGIEYQVAEAVTRALSAFDRTPLPGTPMSHRYISGTLKRAFIRDLATAIAAEEGYDGQVTVSQGAIAAISEPFETWCQTHSGDVREWTGDHLEPLSALLADAVTCGPGFCRSDLSLHRRIIGDRMNTGTDALTDVCETLELTDAGELVTGDSGGGAA